MARHYVESCTFQLNSWRPFHHLQPNISEASTEAGCSNHAVSVLSGLSKRPCLSDRATSFHTVDFGAVDISKLSLSDEKVVAVSRTRETLRMIARRKRRRQGSRSVSGKSCSDWSGRRRCCSVGAASAAHGTCSDFPLAVGTDSSGELFGNGVSSGVGGGGLEPNWLSDVSEARIAKLSLRDREDRESYVCTNGILGAFDTPQSVESGYGSEPGYRGDVEYGYGDEVDEEDDDSRALFWDTDSRLEAVGENTFLDQKVHHRGRRRKHDLRLMCSSRWRERRC